MTTRMSDSIKLVGRCQKVADAGIKGWRVQDTPDGWKIFDPRGGMHSIHKTYSDVRSLTNARIQLENSGGLKIDEAEARKLLATQRRVKLSADRAAEENRAQEIAGRNQGMITRAAGPYLTEACEPDIAWLTAEHPSPWMRWMHITPAIAAKLLDDHNSDNRKISDDTSIRYASIILSGQWHLTHQGLAIDTRGLVQDGQHRLEGVRLAGETDPDISVPFAVFVGMDPANFKAIDEGRLRSAGQMLRKSGEGNATHLPTCIRLVAACRSENPREFMRQKMPTVSVFDVFDSDPDMFREAVTWGSRHYKRSRCTPGPLAAAWYMLKKANGEDNEFVEAFLEGFVWNRKHNTDLILPDDDPRTVLRKKFDNSSVKPLEALNWIIHSWNNIVQGYHPRYLRVNAETNMAEVLLCLPGHGVVPRALRGEAPVAEGIAA